MKKFIYCIMAIALLYNGINLFAQEKGLVKCSSESGGYKCDVEYPELVQQEQTGKITLHISNISDRSDKELMIEVRDVTKGDGAGRFLLPLHPPFKIVKVEPMPKFQESVFGATYIDYKGLGTGEMKNISVYFKISKEGNYLQKLMFYTDRHSNEEYKLISMLKIKCIK